MDYRVLGGDWGGLDVGLISCPTAIWWVGGWVRGWAWWVGYVGGWALLGRLACSKLPHAIAGDANLEGLLGRTINPMPHRHNPRRHGAGDCVVAPTHAQWWHRRVAGSELHILPDEGHISVVGRHAERIWRDLLPGQLQPIAADE